MCILLINKTFYKKKKLNLENRIRKYAVVRVIVHKMNQKKKIKVKYK